jgi:hypothetical protein
LVGSLRQFFLRSADGGKFSHYNTKRQKERARQEKQAEKAQRRAERKLQQTEEDDTVASRPSGGPVITYDDVGNPKGLNFDDF